jgi:hypothetical protein
MPFTGYQQAVGALPTYRADPAFGGPVHARCLRRCSDDLNPHRGEHRVERGGEPAVPIAQQEPQRIGSLVQNHEQVPAPLSRASWVSICRTCQSNWYASEALTARIVTGKAQRPADNGARQRLEPGLRAAPGKRRASAGQLACENTEFGNTAIK